MHFICKKKTYFLMLLSYFKISHLIFKTAIDTLSG